jgi:hypothetical protein
LDAALIDQRLIASSQRKLRHEDRENHERGIQKRIFALFDQSDPPDWLVNLSVGHQSEIRIFILFLLILKDKNLRLFTIAFHFEPTANFVVNHGFLFKISEI